MNKRLYLLQDCDCDGLLATSMLYCYLSLVNPDIQIIPLFHDKKQHGLTDNKIMEYLRNAEPGLVIMPDAGSNDINEAKELTGLGYKIICLDHHKASINQYATVVNNQLSPGVKNKSLSGCGVTFKFMQALDKKLGLNYANQFISYVAISIISDSMDLRTYENRFFVKYGLQHIHPNIKPFTDKWINGNITGTELSFNVINKWNSLIRYHDAKAKEDLFYSLCGIVDAKNSIKMCNKSHKYQRDYVKQAIEYIEVDNTKNVLVCMAEEKSAYTGLLANRISGQYNKPTLLIYQEGDRYYGSCRSPIDFREIIDSCEYSEWANGHERANGVCWTVNNHDDMVSYLYSLDCLPEPCQDVIMSYECKDVPLSQFGLFEPYEGLWGVGVNRPLYHIHNVRIKSSDIKSTRVDAQIFFNVYGAEFRQKYVSNIIKDEKWHINEDKELEIECIGELIKSDYNRQDTVLMHSVNVKVVEPEEFDFDKLFY